MHKEKHLNDSNDVVRKTLTLSLFSSSKEATIFSIIFLATMVLAITLIHTSICECIRILDEIVHI
jgi:hypothetical protein